MWNHIITKITYLAQYSCFCRDTYGSVKIEIFGQFCVQEFITDTKLDELATWQTVVCYLYWAEFWKSAYIKRYRALIIISGMKVFAHLNDYILLTNCKLQNMSNTWHTRGLDRLSTNKIIQCCILFFRQTWTQNHDFLVWTTVTLSIAVKRDLAIYRKKKHFS